MPAHLSHIHPVVSTALIKPFHPRLGDPAPPIVIDDQEEFEVEDITDFNLLQSKRRDTPPVVEFRVRWKGSAEDSWHEPPDFENSQDILQSFLQKLPKKQRVRVLKAFDTVSLARLPFELRSLID